MFGPRLFQKVNIRDFQYVEIPKTLFKVWGSFLFCLKQFCVSQSEINWFWESWTSQNPKTKNFQLFGRCQTEIEKLSNSNKNKTE